MQEASSVRPFAGDDGESHFENLQIERVPTDFAPLNVATISSAQRCNFIGAFSDWHGEEPHPTPRRQFFCTMSGEYQVTASDGQKRRFPAGSLLLLEDTTGKGHSTRVVSQEDLLVFAVALE